MGREFRDDDSPASSSDPPATLSPTIRPPEPPGPRVVIINESFAKKFLAGRNPLGLHLCDAEKYDPAKAFEIVGVAKDAHYFGLRQATEPMVYFAIWRGGASSRILCLRTGAQEGGLGDALRRAVTAIDPAIPLMGMRTIEQEIDNNILEDRLITTISGFFGTLALLLAAVGLYGVISYSVTRRTREIGIRMALGAERRSVIWLVAQHAAALVAIGAAIGIPAALALTKLVKTFLYNVKPNDPITIVSGALALIAVAALASAVPARRATRVDPMVALRQD
jgi:predicted permease